MDTEKYTTIHIRRDLKDRLALWGKLNKRSATLQLEHTLEQIMPAKAEVEAGADFLAKTQK